MSLWISTDLDGTLLDHNNYDYSAANSALSLCKEHGIPIVLNTSKTQAETQSLHQALNLSTPIVVENGSALIFNDPKFKTHVFGQARSTILDFIDDMRSTHDIQLTGFNDLGVSGIIEHTGLTNEAAELAADKHYSEPFIWHDSDEKLQQLKLIAQQHDLSVLKGGRFYHLQGQTNKAKPLLWLQNNLNHLFENHTSKAKLICLGDNQNDVAMLNIADYPVWVKSLKEQPQLTNTNKAIYTKKVGPEGWNEAVTELLTANLF